jgi:hypothetical protein
MFRLRLLIENGLFAALVIAMLVWKPVWWIAVAAVVCYVVVAILLHRMIPPPSR